MRNNFNFKEIANKIYSLGYVQCDKQEHQGQELSLICLNDDCSGIQRLLCCHCELNDHSDHHIIPLKEYILQIYRLKIQTQCKPCKLIQFDKKIPQQIDSRHQTNNINYLSFLSFIQDKKLQALSLIHQLKKKLLQQFNQLQTHITLSSNKYMQKIRLVSEISFGEINLLDKITRIVQENHPNKISSLINTYLDNFYIPEHHRANSTNHKNQISNNKTQEHMTNPMIGMFSKIREAFSNQIENFEKTLNGFDLTFIPKLSKIIQYKDIKLTQTPRNYQWDLQLKPKHFLINEKNSKCLKVLTISQSEERFALIKMQFMPKSKSKYTWAIRVNNLTGWLGVGIALKKQIINKKLKFQNYNMAGHGCYMISNNCYSWSNSQMQSNSKNLSFSFYTGDVIILEYSPSGGELIFKKYQKNKVVNTFKLKVSNEDKQKVLSPCINMLSINDEVQIIEVPE